MNAQELENWRRVKKALAAAGKTSSPIYARACEVLSKQAMIEMRGEKLQDKSL